MIHIHSLLFNYPGENGFRLEIPGFQVEPGEKVAVIGPSGSGKTTLLHLISGIYLPVQGQVQVNNIRIDQLADSGRRDFRITQIGFIFQDFELLDYLSVMDNILHPYRISSALKLNRSVRQRAAELADAMGIGDLLKRRPGELSQGEKQRAAICRALLPSPQLILADEATGNLDPENKSRILDLLFHNVQLSNATLLAVTHDHELLPRFDRVINFSHFYTNDRQLSVNTT